MGRISCQVLCGIKVSWLAVQVQKFPLLFREILSLKQTNQYSFSDCPGRLRPRQCTDEVACEPSHDIGNDLWIICESATEMLLTRVGQLEAMYIISQAFPFLATHTDQAQIWPCHPQQVSLKSSFIRRYGDGILPTETCEPFIISIHGFL